MSKLFNNKYRIASARLPHWDYASDGSYFITICTHNRTHFFGECTDDKMTLSTVGAVVQGFWFEIPKHFPFVQLGEFQVMPNHIHGILNLHKSEIAFTELDSGNSGSEIVHVETLQCNVSTSNDSDNLTSEFPNEKSDYFKKISPKSGSISTIIRSYKAICSKHIHQAFPDLKFEWQTRFWDNIIRDAASFEVICDYIIDNPKKWEEDKFYS